MTQEAPMLGWEPDPPEFNLADRPANDYLAASAPPEGATLEDQMPPVQNQKQGGSCVLWSVAQAIYQCHRRQGVSEPELMSVMRPWWLCRREAGLEDWNTGTHIRRAARIIRGRGFCRERHDPYDWRGYGNAPGAMADRMSQDQTKENALKLGRVDVEFRRLPPRSNNRAQDVRLAIASGHVVVMGWKLPERFKRKDVDWSKPFRVVDGEPMAGGHAMVIYGYIAGGGFLVRNSWGPRFGNLGSFIMHQNMVIDGHDPWIFTSAPYYSDAA